MKKKKFYLSPQQKEIAVNVLKVLAMGVVLAVAIVAPNAVQLFEIFTEDKKELKMPKSNQAWKVIKKLQKQKHVGFSQKDGKIIVTITKEGEKELLKYNLEKMKLKKPKRWDSWWRVIIFDIPESKKKAREALRNLLKKMDFYQLQKSVFIHPYECKKEINYIKEVYEISYCVTYLRAKRIDNEEFLKHKFDLDNPE